ncbi:response regulator [Candidatus Falkowbacteria bacterium]|nr:response regulator [Candidatus Falkowbacteria bacterium]
MANKKYKILMVEDDPDQILMYRTQLEIDGFKVFDAKKYDDVVKILVKEKPDMVLLDIVLGAESGEDILKKLSAKHVTDVIPVIVFSNLKSDKDEQKYIKLGAREYWPKTKFLPRQLSDVIMRFLK